MIQPLLPPRVAPRSVGAGRPGGGWGGGGGGGVGRVKGQIKLIWAGEQPQQSVGSWFSPLVILMATA